MSHIAKTISDLEFLIGELQRSVEILRNIASGGGIAPAVAPEAITTQPVAPAAVPDRPRKGRPPSPDNVLRKAIKQFDRAWFSAAAVHDWVFATYKGSTNASVGQVLYYLPAFVKDGILEARGEGEDRRYRVKEAA